MDLRLAFDTTTLTGDLAFTGGDLEQEQSLHSAVVLSLFTDARLPDDQPLPPGESWRRGVWFDGLDGDAADRFGSLLWLLLGEKQTEATRLRAIAYSHDALAWMIRDGVARQIEVTAEWQRTGMLLLGIDLHRPNGTASRFDLFWQALQSRAPMGGLA